MPIATNSANAPVDPVNGWWVVQDTNGAVGLIKSAPTSNATGAIYIGAASTLGQLASKFGEQIPNAINAVGGTASQENAFMAEIDTAAGKDVNTTFLYIGAGTQPGDTGGDISANPGVSTTPSGDANAAGISVPGADIAGGIWSWLTTAANWVRIGEYAGGAILIYLAVKGLTGVDTPNLSTVAKVAAVAPK